MAIVQTGLSAPTPTRVEDARGLAVVEDSALKCSLQRVAGAPCVWLAIVNLQVV